MAKWELYRNGKKVAEYHTNTPWHEVMTDDWDEDKIPNIDDPYPFNRRRPYAKEGRAELIELKPLASITQTAVFEREELKKWAEKKFGIDFLPKDIPSLMRKLMEGKRVTDVVRTRVHVPREQFLELWQKKVKEQPKKRIRGYEVPSMYGEMPEKEPERFLKEGAVKFFPMGGVEIVYVPEGWTETEEFKRIHAERRGKAIEEIKFRIGRQRRKRIEERFI